MVTSSCTPVILFSSLQSSAKPTTRLPHPLRQLYLWLFARSPAAKPTSAR